MTEVDKRRQKVPHHSLLTESTLQLPCLSQSTPTHSFISCHCPSWTLYSCTWVFSLFPNIPIPCFPVCHLLYLDNLSSLCGKLLLIFKGNSTCLLRTQLCSSLWTPFSWGLTSSWVFSVSPWLDLGHNGISLNVFEWSSCFEWYLFKNFSLPFCLPLEGKDYILFIILTPAL